MRIGASDQWGAPRAAREAHIKSMVSLISVKQLYKRYAQVTAVNGLSFDLHDGEIFAMLGPNGAGKTTTIRILMDILTADGGEVAVLGGSPRAAKKRVGYLPEERGLYQNMLVLDVLIYLAALKGWRRQAARRRALDLLERVDLADRANAKVRELSRGMQQKLQLLAALINDPDVVILDEPFQGLDPVNVESVKALLKDFRRAGKGIMLSSHQMNLVEELCDRILLVDHGQALLYGDLSAIKHEFAGHTVRLRTANGLPDALPGVRRREENNGTWILALAANVSPQQFLADLVEHHVSVTFFETEAKPLAEIFVEVVKGEQNA